MSFYIFQLVEPLILPNTLINLSAIIYQVPAIIYNLSASLLVIHYFYQKESYCHVEYDIHKSYVWNVTTLPFGKS
jgi:hypothetical protein